MPAFAPGAISYRYLKQRSLGYPWGAASTAKGSTKIGQNDPAGRSAEPRMRLTHAPAGKRLDDSRKLEYVPGGSFAKLRHELSIGE